jgi:hypothetical protein
MTPSNNSRLTLVSNAGAPVKSAGQLELFLADFQAVTGLENTSTIELFDALPLYQQQAYTAPTDAPRIEQIKFRKQIITATVRPAGIVQNGKMRYTFAGSREQLVESVLRKMVSEPGSHLEFEDDAASGGRVPVLYTSRYAIRKRLAEIGHGFKDSEIREALEILAGSHFSFSGLVNGEEFEVEMEKGIIGRSHVTPKNDPTGKRSLERITLHSLVLKSIALQTYRQIDWKRLNSLSRPGARWLYQRITHHFIGVESRGGPLSQPYNIDLETILASSGMRRYQAIKDNVRQVRYDLKELADKGILDIMRPFNERIRKERQPGVTTGRPKILGAVWELYMSSVTADEIIRSNKKMSKRVRSIDT